MAEFAARARQLIEGGLPLTWVAGEVSNFTRAASGHCYFSLKDASAQLRCVMFRHRAQLLEWSVANGQQVEVRATPTLYEPRGDFQLNVDFARRAGQGALFEAFQRLRLRLQAEGLFDEALKRPLPPMPHTVGIVTSPQAAALRDVLTTLGRRWPAAAVVLYPTPVQGDGAAARIAAAIELASARCEVEVLIVCRGGGSIEDLWAFNDEAVARAIAGCAMPVVTGIGHETDFTIADFAADCRAPTPTAAAEMAAPDRRALQERIAVLAHRLVQHASHRLARHNQDLDRLAGRLRHPGERLRDQQRLLAGLRERLGRAMDHDLQAARLRLQSLQQRQLAARPHPRALQGAVATLVQRLQLAFAGRQQLRHSRSAHAAAALQLLNPLRVLERGYSVVRDADGRIVADAAGLAAGDRVDIRFARGAARARVEDRDS